MSCSIRSVLAAAACAMVLTVPSAADAATWAMTTGYVHLRRGPSIGYPIITTVPEGARVLLDGCERGFAWCHVAWHGYDGWMSGHFLSSRYRRRRLGYVAPYLAIPFAGFYPSYDYDEYGGYYPPYRPDHHHGRRDFHHDFHVRDRTRPEFGRAEAPSHFAPYQGGQGGSQIHDSSGAHFAPTR